MKKTLFQPLGFLFGVVLLGLAFVACGPEEADQTGQERGNFKKSYAEAIDNWTSPTLSDTVSIITWLSMEQELICRMVDRLVEGGADPAQLDPKGFCEEDPGMDPTRPPPEPKCDWGTCPEDP